MKDKIERYEQIRCLVEIELTQIYNEIALCILSQGYNLKEMYNPQGAYRIYAERARDRLRELDLI